MIHIAKLILFSAFFLDLYNDGYWKRTGKILYWTKDLIYLLFLIFAFIEYNNGFLYEWNIYISILLAKKPISDFGYTFGYTKDTWLYIGETNWTDKLIRKIGLYGNPKLKAPVLFWIYCLLIFIGILL